MSDWKKIAKDNEIASGTYSRRINHLGWSEERAATTLVIENRWPKLALQNGISRSTYSNRVNKYGWTPHQAATTLTNRRKDRHWIEIAEKNGITRSTYTDRVDEMLWTPEEASSVPVMTKKEVSTMGNEIKAELNAVINERAFKDKNNLYKITPQHIKRAKENDINEHTVKSRVYNYGWTLQEAITTPTRNHEFTRPEGYEKYLEKAKKNGLTYSLYQDRVKMGWNLEDASSLKPVSPFGPKESRMRRPDKEWLKLAIENGINRSTYRGRVDTGWTPEEAATNPTLKKGNFLNEERKENSLAGFRKFRGIKEEHMK